jgi:hypothetical protein
MVSYSNALEEPDIDEAIDSIPGVHYLDVIAQARSSGGISSYSLFASKTTTHV